jgi:hypothetical protein
MEFGRLSVKYFLEEPEALVSGQLIPTFHDWIRRSKVEGLLIDVSDYRHVPEGPGVMLVGHGCDYRVDLAGRRPGLCYVEKRRANGTPIDPIGRLRTLFRSALVGCRTLEREPSLAGIRFGSQAMTLQFLDRLRVPDVETAREEVGGPLVEFLTRLYRPAGVHLEWEGEDRRRPPAVRLTAAGAPGLDRLIARLA